MKHYADLTEREQEAAVQHFIEVVLDEIASGAVRFNDELNHDDLQARIDAAWDEAHRLQTPWFIGSIIMETCADDIRSLAIPLAEDAIYTEDEASVVLSTIQKRSVEVPS